MGAGMVSERDPAPRRLAAARSRQAVIMARLREGVLVRRAKGFKRERIAYEIRRTVDEVSRILRAARAAGEPRALNDREAAAAAAALAVREPRLAAEIKAGEPDVLTLPPPAPKPAAAPASLLSKMPVIVEIPLRPLPIAAPVAPPPAPAVVSPATASNFLDPLRLAPEDRTRLIEKLREAAGPERKPFEGMSPRGHLHHLADLYQHCDRFYPEHTIRSDSLALRFSPEPAGLGGGAALMCAQA